MVEDVEEAGVEARFENQTHLQGGNGGLEWDAHFHSGEFKITEAEVNLPFHQLNHRKIVLFFFPRSSLITAGEQMRIKAN